MYANVPRIESVYYRRSDDDSSESIQKSEGVVASVETPK